MPYLVSIRFLSNGHYLPSKDFGFTDVFDDGFIKASEQKIKDAATRHGANPYLIGYYWTDTPRWDIDISRERHGTDWVAHIKNLPAESAGKKRFVSFLKSRYASIGAFNKAYGTYFLSFEALLNARFDHLDKELTAIRKDDELFLGEIAEHLYRTLYEQMKKYDSDHLIFGDKYLLGDHPQAVLEAASKYVDVISVQPGPSKGPGPGPGEDELLFNMDMFNEMHRLSGKPIIICDHQTSFHTSKYPITLWHQLPTAEASIEAHRTFLKDCIPQSYIIGYQRCQYIDVYDSRRGLLKKGLLRENGLPYEKFAKGFARNNKWAIESIFRKK